MGIRQNDPQVLHAHSNTLSTLLWLLYSPRSEAFLVGSREFGERWRRAFLGAEESMPRYFVVSSCSTFSPASPFGRLVGDSVTEALLRSGAFGDYAYQFLAETGDALSQIHVEESSILRDDQLRRLARRRDARVVLVAGGTSKWRIMSLVLARRMCNVLITDEGTAKHMVGHEEVRGERRDREAT